MEVHYSLFTFSLSFPFLLLIIYCITSLLTWTRIIFCRFHDSFNVLHKGWFSRRKWDLQGYNYVDIHCCCRIWWSGDYSTELPGGNSEVRLGVFERRLPYWPYYTCVRPFPFGHSLEQSHGGSRDWNFYYNWTFDDLGGLYSAKHKRHCRRIVGTRIYVWHFSSQCLQLDLSKF